MKLTYETRIILEISFIWPQEGKCAYSFLESDPYSDLDTKYLDLASNKKKYQVRNGQKSFLKSTSFLHTDLFHCFGFVFVVHFDVF